MPLTPSQILTIRQRAKSFGGGVAPVGGVLGEIDNAMLHLSNDQHVPAGSPQGGQFASKDEYASRSRRDTQFGTPIKGPSGAAITHYEWKWKHEERQIADDMKIVRVSDWGESQASAATGREIVHHFGVTTPDGIQHTVSLESAAKLLGYGKSADMGLSDKTKITSAKTLAKQQVELEAAKAEYAKAKKDRDAYDAAKFKIVSAGLPAITVEPHPNNKPEDYHPRVIYRMGDADVPGDMTSHESSKYGFNDRDDERRTTLRDHYLDKRLAEQGHDRHTKYREGSAKSKVDEIEKRISKTKAKLGMNLSATIHLDRGTQGDEGHFVTIEHHVVFIKDDTGTGANGRGGKFTKHGLESKLLKHHAESGGDDAASHRAAFGNAVGDTGQYNTSTARPFHFEGDSHADLPGEVKQWIDKDISRQALFTVSRGKGASGADVMAEMGDDYFRMADEAVSGKVGAALQTAKNSQDPEARFHAAIYENLPQTKTAVKLKGDFTAKGGRQRTRVITHGKTQQGIIAPSKLREGHTFTINGTKMSVVNNDGALHIEGHGYPSTPVDALSEVPIDKHSLKMGKKSVSREVVPFSAAMELSRKELTGGRWVTIHPHGGHGDGDYKRLYIKGDGTIAAGPKAMVGKNIGHLHATHEVREKHHQDSPLRTKEGGSFTAQTVDPNKQLGMFAKDDMGNHQEVGERAGQGSLFHDTAKAKPVVDAAQAKRDEDAKATAEMFPAKKPETVSTPSDKIGRDTTPIAATKDEGPKLGKAAHEMTSAELAAKGITPAAGKLLAASHRPRVKAAIARGDSVPAHVLAEYPGIENEVRDDAAKDAASKAKMSQANAANKAFSDKAAQLRAADAATAAQEEKAKADELEKYREDRAATAHLRAQSEHLEGSSPRSSAGKMIINEHRHAIISALASGKSVPANVLADYPDLAPKPTAATTIAAQKGDDLESKVDSNDLDGGAMRDLKAKSMERVSPQKKAADARKEKKASEEAAAAKTFADVQSYGADLQAKHKGAKVAYNSKSGYYISAPDSVTAPPEWTQIGIDKNSKRYTTEQLKKFNSVNLSAPSPYYLSASSTFAEPAELSATLPKQFNGADIHYRWQDAAVSGQWKHPTKGFTLNIDNDRIDRWVRGIDLARANGVDLPIVKDHRETADSCLGYIYGARQNNGRLELLNGYIGADSLAIAQRNKLSIGIDPNFKDSRGTSYGEAIRHVAVTPIPVIHGQQGFLAASRDGQQEAEYLIPVAKETNDMTLTDEQRKEICDVLGVEHVDDDAAISLLTATVTDLQTECLTLSAAQDAATAKITELSAAATPVVVETPKPDPRDIELAKARIELSATKGDVPAWLAKALTAKLDNSVLLLSRDGDDKPTFVAELLQLFEGSKLGAKAVEKTGVQTLSREVPDGENKAAATVNPYEETIAKLTGQAK